MYNQYWPSETAMLRHKKGHKKKSHREIEEEKSNEEKTKEGGEKVWFLVTLDEVKNIPLFDNIFEVFKSPFVDGSSVKKKIWWINQNPFIMFFSLCSYKSFLEVEKCKRKVETIKSKQRGWVWK